MKYLMLDTNIYLDMIIFRDENHKSDICNILIKLLNADKVKLLVPSIVITEVYRLIDKEIDKIGEDLTGNIRSIKNLNWFNNVKSLEGFTQDIDSINAGLNNLKKKFKANKDIYKDSSKNLFNEMFEHSNCIVIEETGDIILKSRKREIHKLRPFQLNRKKECLADSIIIETLINIDSLIDFNKNEDKVFFVSKNKSDFAQDEKEKFHNDIQSSIKEDMEACLFYRIYFYKTLKNDFEEEIELSDLAEELAKEFEAEQKELEEELYYENLDNEREMCGLSSLGDESVYEEIISQKPEIYTLVNQIETMYDEINNKGNEFYEIYNELSEIIEQKNIVDLKEIIMKNPLFEVLIDFKDEDDIKFDILYLLKGSIGDEEYTEFIEEMEYKDFFMVDDILFDFTDSKGNRYILKTEGYLSPINGEEDNISIVLVRNSKNIAEATINVFYGYSDINDDGNIGGNCTQESIEIYNIKEIENEMSKIENYIINDIDNKIDKIKKTIKTFR